MGSTGARSKLRGLTSCVNVAALLLVPATASAADRYAEPGGNGPAGLNQCLASDPCSLESAIEGAVSTDVVDGDRILMLSGTHNTGAAEVTITDAITVEPAPGAGRPVLSSTSATRALLDFNTTGNSVIRGFSIIHSNAAGRGLVTGADDLVERMFVISNGLSACNPSESLVRDSVCVLASSSVGTGAIGSTVNGAGTRITRLRNVTAISKAAGRPAIYLSAENDANLTFSTHNVIADGNPDAFAQTDGTAGTTAFIGFASSSFATVDKVGTGSSVTPPGGGSANITAPAQFANFASNDFHQLATSPTVDRGSPDPYNGSLDFDGAPRTQGPSIDIGAFETSVPPVPATPPAGGPAPVVGNPCNVKKTKKKGKPKASAAKKKTKKKRCGKKRKKKR